MRAFFLRPGCHGLGVDETESSFAIDCSRLECNLRIWANLRVNPVLFESRLASSSHVFFFSIIATHDLRKSTFSPFGPVAPREQFSLVHLTSYVTGKNYHVELRNVVPQYIVIASVREDWAILFNSNLCKTLIYVKCSNSLSESWCDL